jgi:hypothetical protein
VGRLAELEDGEQKPHGDAADDDAHADDEMGSIMLVADLMLVSTSRS